MTRVQLMIFVLALVLVTGSVAAADREASIRSWQMARLLEPTQGDLKSEAKGRVMIYDGLTDKDVDRALDQQFDRLDHMMFTRVVVTDDSGEAARDEDGEVVTEGDDGCD
jgi:hypothetical protein